jgi:hypothetical protein
VGERKYAYRVLIRKSEGKIPLVMPKRSLKDNINMELKGIGWDGTEWIDLAQGSDKLQAIVNTIMNLLFP